MRTAASPAQSFSTVHVFEHVSFAPPDWTYTSSQQPVEWFSGDSVEVWPCPPSLFALSWTPCIDSHVGNNYVVTCDLQWGHLHFPFHLCFLSSCSFILFHQSPLASQCDSIYPFWSGSVACLGASVMKVKTSTLVYRSCQVLYMTQLHTCTEILMRTPEWGFFSTCTWQTYSDVTGNIRSAQKPKFLTLGVFNQENFHL